MESPPDLTAQQLPAILLPPGEMLPEALCKQIVALGPEAIEPLQKILDDEDLLDADGPADGWAPIRAARLLGKLRAEFEPLGAELTPVQRERFDFLDADRLRKRALATASPAASTARAAGAKVGRNDPCACGSGTKFKKCCGQ